MSKGTYSHSNRHRMHELKQKGDDFCCKNSTKKDEPQVTNYDEVANLKRIIKDYADDLKHWKNMWANQRDDIKLLGDEIVKLRRENEEIKKDEPQGTNHDEVANLKGIIKEQKRILSTCMYALQENEELMKDKERLDWILSDAGRYWLSSREDIDKEME